jgi:hypothetical protein
MRKEALYSEPVKENKAYVIRKGVVGDYDGDRIIGVSLDLNKAKILIKSCMEGGVDITKGVDYFSDSSTKICFVMGESDAKDPWYCGPYMLIEEVTLF